MFALWATQFQTYIMFILNLMEAGIIERKYHQLETIDNVRAHWPWHLYGIIWYQNDVFKIISSLHIYMHINTLSRQGCMWYTFRHIGQEKDNEWSVLREIKRVKESSWKIMVNAFVYLEISHLDKISMNSSWYLKHLWVLAHRSDGSVFLL